MRAIAGYLGRAADNLERNLILYVSAAVFAGGLYFAGVAVHHRSQRLMYEPTVVAVAQMKNRLEKEESELHKPPTLTEIVNSEDYLELKREGMRKLRDLSVLRSDYELAAKRAEAATEKFLYHQDQQTFYTDAAVLSLAFSLIAVFGGFAESWKRRRTGRTLYSLERSRS